MLGMAGWLIPSGSSTYILSILSFYKTLVEVFIYAANTSLGNLISDKGSRKYIILSCIYA